MPATVVTRRTDAPGPRTRPGRHARACASALAGAGRGGKYAMVPRGARGALRRLRGAVRRARRARHARARAARRWSPRARWASAGRPAARGQRRDDGRGLHLGHGARPAAAAARVVARPSRARNLLLRGRATRSWPCRALIARRVRGGGRARGTRRAASRTASTRARFRPASRRRAGGAARAARAARRTRRIIIYTGRLLRGKGLEALLDGVRARRGREPARTSLIVGSGDGPVAVRRGRAARARRAARASPARVTFAGPRGRGRGLAARRRRVRLPVAVRGARPLADRGGGLRPACGRLAHGRHRGRDRRRAVGPPGRAGRRRGARGRARTRSWSDPGAPRGDGSGRPRDRAARASTRASPSTATARCSREVCRTRRRVRIALTGATGYTGGRLLARLRGARATRWRRSRAPGSRAPGTVARRPLGGGRSRATRTRSPGWSRARRGRARGRRLPHRRPSRRVLPRRQRRRHRAAAGSGGPAGRAPVRAHVDRRRPRRRDGSRPPTRRRRSRPATSTRTRRRKRRRWRLRLPPRAAGCRWPSSGPARSTARGETRLLKLFRAIARGRYAIVGSGRPFYHPVFIDDLLDGYLLAARAAAGGGGGVHHRRGRATSPRRELADAHRPRTPADACCRSTSPPAPAVRWATSCEAVCVPFGIEPPLHRRRVDFWTKSRAFSIDKARRLLGYAPAGRPRRGRRAHGRLRTARPGWL